MSYIYANKIGIAASEEELCIRFTMHVPKIDTDGKLEGEDDVETSDVILSRKSALALRGMLDELLKDDEK